LVFCISLEPPFFADCHIDNIVVRTAMRAVPEDELIEHLAQYSAVDRAVGNSLLHERPHEAAYHHVSS
jgi:hypothetical protein